MADITDLVRRESAHGHGARAHDRVGIVTSYNEDTHAVKVKIKPEDKETGWMPLGALHVGNGFGIAIGANVGDQLAIGFLDGDPNAPYVKARLYSDKQKPPKVKSGEMVLFHETGNKLYFDKDGAITLAHKSGGQLLWDKDGVATLDNGSRAVKVKGSVAINPP